MTDTSYATPTLGTNNRPKTNNSFTLERMVLLSMKRDTSFSTIRISQTNRFNHSWTSNAVLSHLNTCVTSTRTPPVTPYPIHPVIMKLVKILSTKRIPFKTPASVSPTIPCQFPCLTTTRSTQLPFLSPNYRPLTPWILSNRLMKFNPQFRPSPRSCNPTQRMIPTDNSSMTLALPHLK